MLITVRVPIKGGSLAVLVAIGSGTKSDWKSKMLSQEREIERSFPMVTPVPVATV